MSFAKCFEELEVWKEGCRFVVDIYATTQNSQFIKDRDFSAQLRRAAVSIPSNIAEGFEKGSKRDFARYLLMARGSAGEIRTQLYLAKSLNYLKGEQFSALKDKIVYISSMLTRLITSLK